MLPIIVIIIMLKKYKSILYNYYTNYKWIKTTMGTYN